MYDNIHIVQHRLLEILVELDKICNENGLKYQLAYGTALGAVRHKGFIPWDDDLDVMVEIDHYDRLCAVLRSNLSSNYELFTFSSHKSYEELFARVGMRGTPHYHLHLDIFPMVGTPRSKLLRLPYIMICYFVYRSYFIKRIPLRMKKVWKWTLALVLKLILYFIPEDALVYIAGKLSKAFRIDRSDTLYSLCGTYGSRDLIPKAFLTDSVLMDFEGHLFPVPANWHGYLTHLYGNYMVPKKTKNYIS